MFPSNKYDHLPHDNNLSFDFTSPPYNDQNMIKPADYQLQQDQDHKKDSASPFASLRILKNFATRSSKSNGDQKIHIPTSNREPNQNMSTIERIRKAGLHFIECSSSKTDKISDRIRPDSGSGLTLSDDEAKDIDVLLTLLASAEKTGQREFDEASRLVELCGKMCSSEGNPVERLVYYFCEAIREKINRETGREECDGGENMHVFDLQKALMHVDASILAFHQKVPMSQVFQFSSMRTILENIGDSRHVHVIDLEIRSGMQYTVMMQAIASTRKQIKRLKITAIGTRSKSKIQETCNHLAEFAQSMNIPFCFEIVMVSDMLDFNIDLLELDRHEKVAVYSAISLSSLIVKPNRLEHLMREIRKINPCVTVVTEVEANHTSLTFVNRFINALFFYGALFDSSSVCLGNDDLSRKAGEAAYYAHAIRNIVAAEGDDRTIRHITVDVWRAFFARFRMVEVELSAESFNEAKLLINNFDCGESCTLQVDRRCFLVGWNGVPIFSVSAWKFI